MIVDAVITAGAAAAGVAAAWFFLFVLSVHVRRAVECGGNPGCGMFLTAIRVLFPAAVVAAAFSLGAAPGIAALAGFVIGRAVLTGRIAARLESACALPGQSAQSGGGLPGR